jgi:hypothetical protein
MNSYRFHKFSKVFESLNFQIWTSKNGISKQAAWEPRNGPARTERPDPAHERSTAYKALPHGMSMVLGFQCSSCAAASTPPFLYSHNKVIDPFRYLSYGSCTRCWLMLPVLLYKRFLVSVESAPIWFSFRSVSCCRLLWLIPKVQA